MRVVVNGESREIASAVTVRELLVELGYGNDLVAVERNAQIVPRAEHATTTLADGDELEVVHFVGGG